MGFCSAVGRWFSANDGESIGQRRVGALSGAPQTGYSVFFSGRSMSVEAATIAGATTIPIKARAIRRSCIGFFS